MVRKRLGHVLLVAALSCCSVLQLQCVPQAPAPGGGGFTPPPTGSGSLNQNRNRNRNANTANSNSANVNQNASANTNTNTNDPAGPKPANRNSNVNSANTNTNSSNANSNSAASCNLNCSNVNVNGMVAPDLGPLISETIIAGDTYRSDPVPVIGGTRPFTYVFLQAPGGVRLLGERIRWDAPVAGFAPCVIELQACNCAGGDTLQFTLEVLEEDNNDFRRLSIGHNCTAPDREATDASISDDGNLIVYQSDAANIVPGDTNDASDVFLLNRATGELLRVSVSNSGAQTGTSEPSLRGAISPDGSTVVFQSFGTNLVENDTNQGADIFRYDVATRMLSAVSRNSAGELGNASSQEPAVSANGQVIAFSSAASNLVANDTNGITDIFVHEVATGVTTRVSVATDGTEANDVSSQPSLSRDGRFVAFTSAATNLVAGDANGVTDIFVHDRQTGETIRVSVDTAGVEGNGASANGRIGGVANELIVFESVASNLAGVDPNTAADVFVHDRLAGTTTLASVTQGGTIAGNGPSQSAQITPDGRWVVFQSSASDLVTNDVNGVFDIFLRDLNSGTTMMVTTSDLSGPSDGPSSRPQISADGRFVVFDTKATTFVLSDLDPLGDVIVRDMAP